VAFITGGASGLGEASVRLFVREGARVVIADVQDERGQRVAGELGAAALYQRTDVICEADIAAAVDRALAEFGRLDCMFNNAGIVGAVGPIDEIPAEDYDATMAINLRGVFLGMKHAARVMKPQRSGTILSAELGPFGIRVNCIVPGNMATPMIAGLAGGDPDAVEAIKQGLAVASPLPGRPGLAEDIAHAALFLASDESGYVSGHTLVVDAGLTTGSTSTGKAPPWVDQHSPMIREAGRRGLPES
jgi:NAD(P)-dependent dehydrogenase (short-subunit alcohol dehydrogenase family)